MKSRAIPRIQGSPCVPGSLCVSVIPPPSLLVPAARHSLRPSPCLPSPAPRPRLGPLSLPPSPVSPLGFPRIFCPPPQVWSPLSASSVSRYGLAPFSLLPSDQLALQLTRDLSDCARLTLLQSPLPTDQFCLSPHFPVPREPSDTPPPAFLTGRRVAASLRNGLPVARWPALV